MTRIVRFNRVDPTALFEEFVNRPALRWGNEWSVALDVAENEEGYLVKANLPGVTVDDVELTLEDNVLTIKGEVKADESVEETQYHVRERRTGSFSRSVRFPVLVNSTAVTANFENGVLSLHVPKAEEVKPKRIEIKAA
ncbi:MAG TPA: Hsp20/alpha crystallin family protein [Chloroflexota bacterium]|nr:Hsp20/alpha crystallin family protein [Chloroflexota bacterium]HUM69966.1 Hsp20/alpha crystallin family protein [Chloroflexota bacterium]